MIVGVDAGGTFTDFVLLGEDGETRTLKVSSTPDDPARAVLAGLEELGTARGEPLEIVHGSTVATNALLERDGARVVLLTTEGFEDVIEIGRQARRSIYDLAVTKPAPLVAGEDRFGVRERVGPDGEVLIELTDEIARNVVEDALAREPGSVAVCLLHSYAEPAHERSLASHVRARRPEMFVSASCDVLPEFREYERTSTTAINAHIGPVVSAYLNRLDEELDADRVSIMNSAGSVISLAAASRRPVGTILSGPAAGAVAGLAVGRRAGTDRVISLDMGGTSTDVSLCDGRLSRTSEAEIGGLPVGVPMLDIHTVGAGGGSIAWRDPGGSLRVGPRSAGADPGPICYGMGGEEVTVTDANLYLGRLLPGHFLGGERALHPEPVAAALNAFARRLGLEPRAAAEGILRVARAVMERAIRVISLERGHDPRDFPLVCFGGAGGLHAAELARSLAIPRVIVPPDAGTLSALGTLLAEPAREASRSILAPCADLDAARLEAEFERLETDVRRELETEGLPGEALRIERSLDMRYTGQGFELAVPFAVDYRAEFDARHEERYGYADPSRPAEIVNVRVRATAPVVRPERAPDERGAPDPSAAELGPHAFVFDGEPREGRLYDRTLLRPGHRIEGPAIVVEYGTTTVVPPGVRCEVDERRNFVLTWND